MALNVFQSKQSDCKINHEVIVVLISTHLPVNGVIAAFLL